MKILSPLSNLSEVLSEVTTSAGTYRETLYKNEAATRAVLIDPILRALGWDMGNTSMVEVEKFHEASKADYALHDNNSEVKVVVEAKALGNDLKSPAIKSAILKYAHAYGISDVFVTDGLVWHHYTNFLPGKVVPTHELNLMHGNVVDCAAYLVQSLDAARYWPLEPDIDVLKQHIEELESTVSTLQQELMLVWKAIKTPSAAPAIPSAPIEPELPLVPLNEVENVKGTKPTALRRPDGQIIEVKSWLAMLRECVKFVLGVNPSIPIPLPDSAGKKVMLIGTAKPAKGLSFVQEIYNGEQIYIHLNYSADHCVGNALHILEYLPKEEGYSMPAVAYS